METERLDNDELTCSLCFEPFDESDRLPRLLPACGHTFCSNCIHSLLGNSSEDSPFLCPEDNVECSLAKREVGSLPKNFALIRLMEKRRADRGHLTSRRVQADEHSEKSSSETKAKENSSEKANPATSNLEEDHLKDSVQPECILSDHQEGSNNNNYQKEENQAQSENKQANSEYNDENLCPEHGRRLEVICMEHRARICTNCALFGNHKSHTIRTEEDVLFEITNSAEGLLIMLRKIDQEQMAAESDGNRTKFLNQIGDKFTELRNKTVDKFKEQIAAKESELLEEIETKRKAFEETFTGLINGPEELQEKINDFKSRASDKLASLSEGSLAFDLLEDRKNPETDVLQLGERLIQEQDEVKDIPVKVLEECLKCLKIDFSNNLTSDLDNLGVFGFNYCPDMGSGKKHHSLQQRCIAAMRNQVLSLQKRHFNVPKTPVQEMKPEGLDNSAISNSFTSPPNLVGGVSVAFPFSDASMSTISKAVQGYHVRSHTHNSISSAVTGHNTISQLLNQDPAKELNRGGSNIFDTNSTKDKIKKRASFKLNDGDADNDLLDFEMDKLNLVDIGDGLLENRMSLDVKNGDFGDITPVTTVQRDLSIDLDLQKVLSENNAKLHQNNMCSNTGLNMTDSISMNEIPGAVLQNKILKKKVNFKIHEKFETTMDSLRKDTTEVIDFTGAELGEPGIIHISPFIEKAKSLKTLKLLKNKLNDDAIPILLKALSSNNSIQSLNLAQNVLSEKALDHFISFFQTNRNIRILCLNQNSISLRNVKTKIADLKKLGITVSV